MMVAHSKWSLSTGSIGHMGQVVDPERWSIGEVRFDSTIFLELGKGFIVYWNENIIKQIYTNKNSRPGDVQFIPRNVSRHWKRLSQNSKLSVTEIFSWT
jgi:hypothetical protein